MSTNTTPLARAYLQRELIRRGEKNPSYSLRSFAKNLGISPTVLSLFLSGKRPISKKTYLRIAEKIDLSTNELELLQQEQSVLTSRKHSGANSTAATPAYSMAQINLDTFALIADWYHYAILSYLELPNSKLDRNEIANHLGISVHEAGSAIERLQRLELIEMSHGQWKQKIAPIKIENKEALGATRKFHKQMLERAIESMEQNSFSSRDISSVTFAMNKELIPYAVEKIRQFRRELMHDLETRATPSDVYHLSVQLFPLTKDKESP